MSWTPEIRPLIIGQAPARGNEGLKPFAGRSGRRLAQLADVGDDGDCLPEHFDLLNLLTKWPGESRSGKGDDFDMKAAHAAAEDVTLGLSRRRPSYVLFMGRKVQSAFNLSKRMKILTTYKSERLGAQHRFVLFPHPSGVNQFWNDELNVEQARLMMKEIMSGEA